MMLSRSERCGIHANRSRVRLHCFKSHMRIRVHFPARFYVDKMSRRITDYLAIAIAISQVNNRNGRPVVPLVVGSASHG
jgi:hypothetical protein